MSISLQIFIQILWFLIPWIHLQDLSKNIEILNFSTCFIVWFDWFQRIHQNTFILRGSNSHSSLYNLIRDYFPNFVSLVIFLTHVRVFSTTSRIRSVSEHLIARETNLSRRCAQFSRISWRSTNFLDDLFFKVLEDSKESIKIFKIREASIRLYMSLEDSRIVPMLVKYNSVD